MKLSNPIIIFSLMAGVIFACGNGGKSQAVTVSRSSELVKQGDDLFDNNHQAQAIDLYKMAADTALAEKDNSSLTEAYAQVARCYLSMNEKEQGLPWLEKTEAVAKDTDPKGWTRYLGVKGRYLWRDSVDQTNEAAPVVEEAAKVFSDLYDYSESHQMYERAVDAANMMSIAGDLDNRIQWGLKGIKAAEEGGLDNSLASLWNNLGWNYSDMGRYDESLAALKKARRYHYKKGLEKPMLISDWSVAYAFRMAGEPDSALLWCMRIVGWAKDIYEEDPTPDNAKWLGLCYRELAEASLIKEDYRRAAAGFRSAKMYLDKTDMKISDPEGYKDIEDKIEQAEANVKRYQ